jgi:hypothetical protein
MSQLSITVGEQPATSQPITPPKTLLYQPVSYLARRNPVETNGKLLNCRAITILLPAIPLLSVAITIAVSTINSLIRHNSLIRQLISKPTLA